MKLIKKTINGFTLIEILICVALCSMIGTASVVFLTRGSSNVARGSFNTMAANQAALIAYYLRSDLMTHPYLKGFDSGIGFTLKSKSGSSIEYKRVDSSASLATVYRTTSDGTSKLAQGMIDVFGIKEGYPPVYDDSDKDSDGNSRVKVFYLRLKLKENVSSTHDYIWDTVIHVPYVQEKETTLTKIWRKLGSTQPGEQGNP